jgi:hypothetical protein
MPLLLPTDAGNKNSYKEDNSMETVKKGIQRRKLPPGITIRKDGTVSLHKEAIVEFGLQDMKFAVLDYNAEESQLSITPSVEDPSALPILLERGQTYVIKAKEFLDQSGIAYQERSKVYDVQWDEENKAIVVQIA